MKKITCIICNKEFEAKDDSSAKVCSRSCQTRLGRRNREDYAMLQKRTEETKPCPVCGKLFHREQEDSDRVWAQRVTCSLACRDRKQSQTRGWVKEVTRQCEVCGEEYDSNTGHGFTRTCSRKCASVLSHANGKTLDRIKACDERTKESKKCLGCGELVYRKRHETDSKWQKRKYCGNPKCNRGDPAERLAASAWCRVALYKQIEENYGIPFPNYSRPASDVFHLLETTLELPPARYAVYGNGEIYLSEIGVYPDYFNEDLKLIIEWDDYSHYNSTFQHNEKSNRKKQLIKQYFPGYMLLSISPEKRTTAEIVEALGKIIHRLKSSVASLR